MARRVFITVAEVSGDQHAAELIASLRKLDPAIHIEGHGGPAMAKAGAIVHRETVGGAAMGLRGAFRAIEIYRLLNWTRDYFARQKPDLQICIDSSAMNFHFARVARAAHVPVLYYIAPQLWAWREGRMKTLRASVDRLACILPFEEAYFTGHGVPTTFVGHPLFDELPKGVWRETRGMTDISSAPLIGLLAGSRKSEATHNFPRMLEVADRIRAQFPGAKFMCPTTGATHPIVSRLAAEWISSPDSNAGAAGAQPRQIEIEEAAFDRMVRACDLCITVSGTATLHVAGLGTPMIVVYRASPLLWHSVGRWLMKTRTFALVNVLAGGKPPNQIAALHEGKSAHIVPEFVPWLGSIDAVAEAATAMLTDPSLLTAQRERLGKLIATLNKPGAADRVAELAFQLMNDRAAPGTRE